MHVILKPFIKLLIMLAAVFGIAEIAGIDLKGLLGDLMDKVNGGDGEDEPTTEA